MAASGATTIGLAIVGCGQIVTHHLAAISSIATTAASDSKIRIELRALCDPSAERRRVIAELPASEDLLADQQQPAQYSTLDDLLADAAMVDQIHIIFIAVPHDLHETLALQALNALGDKKMVI